MYIIFQMVNLQDGLINEAFEADMHTNLEKKSAQTAETQETIINRLPIKHIILDFSSTNFADSMGVDMIIQVCFCCCLFLLVLIFSKIFQ
jgi:hypothetical protein